uniref:Uncharacterized protein ALNC14_080730 n=1 Tax=Albugo laibachii Nc14 TaxID=890382 RepID=F0WKX1_9STRA|nr:unnamed protein product [Albugo laibachii Nc14]CCA24780.1 unnamed protein product [Albugo laibachii Nc14]|eukprot:CCA24780.1 unnamed protein product [Albugo laibachii Nc14]
MHLRRVRSFINGEFVDTNLSKWSPVTLLNAATACPATEYVPADTPTVQLALQTARKAQLEWKRKASAERGLILRKAADILTQRNDELALLETIDTGRPIAETTTDDIVSARDCLHYYAGICPSIGGEMTQLGDGNWGYTRREPLGLTVGIGAWNYPLQSAVWKSAPALAFGNSMVFKPSEETPLTAIELASIYIAAGVPKGVFNVVLGDGRVGEMLASDPNVTKVSFTGSIQTGIKVYQTAAKTLKKVTMELGGKSPLIIFEDADVEEAVSAAMMANWYSSGQVCSHGTRVFVHASMLGAFVSRLQERTLQLRIGNPVDPDTDIGPMIHKAHMEKVLGFVAQGVKEGATLLPKGGVRIVPSEELKNGFFLTPAIFVDCTDEMTIVKEEIFGMVMAILPFHEEEEVVSRANDTPYGLSAGIFTNDIKRAHRVAANLEAGTIWINNYNLAPVELPWGGYKHSGLGRENGLGGVHSWTQVKSIYVEMNKVECPYQ